MSREHLFSKKKNNISRLVTFLVIALLFIGVTSIIYYNNLLNPRDIEGQEKTIEIPRGFSLQQIARLLEEEEIIKKDLAFIVSARLNQRQNQLQSGKYLLSSGMSTNEIIDKIANGQVVEDSIRVTIPEGFELEMIATRLEEAGLTTADSFIQTAENVEDFDFPFLDNLPENNERQYPLEGYLFPDTYNFPKNATDSEIIATMLGRFGEIFTEEYAQRAEDMGMSIDDIVIMASLVEREARHHEERNLIAGVYYKRLDIGMKLQCDATVQYALGDRKTRLLYSDLEIDSPYNTYQHYGLPIGPISSVGQASIEAALYPEDTEYLYYVARQDGSHVFTKTFAEHNKAKREVLN